jgi:hypothetical protein
VYNKKMIFLLFVVNINQTLHPAKPPTIRAGKNKFYYTKAKYLNQPEKIEIRTT